MCMNSFLKLGGIFLLSGLLGACGGDSVNSTQAVTQSPDTETPPAPALEIVGNNEVASGSAHTLRALTEDNGLASSWSWQFDRGILSDENVEVDGDRLSYTAPDVNNPTTINFAVQRNASGQSPQNASLAVVVFALDDATKRPTLELSDDLSADEGTDVLLSVSAAARQGRSIRSIAWQQLSGPAAQLLGANDQDTFSIRLPQVDTEQTLRFAVQAQDSGGFSASAEVAVRVLNIFENTLPVVSAGADQESAANSTVNLHGSATDADGEIVSVLWEALGQDSSITINQADSLNASFMAPNVSEDRDVVIRLTATDNDGASGSDTAVVQIIAAPNDAPEISSAYVDPGVAYSGETVQLIATGQDPDGNALSFKWQQIPTQDQALLTIEQDESGNISASLPTLSKNENFVLVLSVSDGISTVSREVGFQGVASFAAAPNPLSCLSQPLQAGCPLAALAPILDPNSFSACATDPASSDCIFTQLAGPAVLACIDNPGPQTCATALTSIADPSYVLEQLGEEDSAGVCNPAYDDNSYEHYMGALHEHTAYSDGTYLTRPADVFQRVKSAGLDFAGSSDHSDNMALPLSLGRGDCSPEQFLDCYLFVDPDNRSDAFVKWKATQEQALAASDNNFTAFRGFEWTSDRFGHANIFFSRNIINAKTGPGYAVSMVRFWQWFTYPAQFGGGSDGLLSFNHPGREDAIESIVESLGGDPGFTFNDFRYVAAADYRTVGIEVFGKGSEYDSDGPNGSWLSYALDKGWYLAPVGSEDHHDTRWGDDDLPKTVLIARSRSRDDLREAMLARRFYAVAQNYNGIRLDYRIDDNPMGSRLRKKMGDKLNISINLSTNSVVVGAPRFELVGPNNTIIESSNGTNIQKNIIFNKDIKYIFVRVLDGEKPIAFSAPIWIAEGSEPLPQCQVPQIWKDEAALLPSI